MLLPSSAFCNDEREGEIFWRTEQISLSGQPDTDKVRISLKRTWCGGGLQSNLQQRRSSYRGQSTINTASHMRFTQWIDRGENAIQSNDADCWGNQLTHTHTKKNVRPWRHDVPEEKLLTALHISLYICFFTILMSNCIHAYEFGWFAGAFARQLCKFIKFLSC